MADANESNTHSIPPKRRDFLFTLGTAAAAGAGLAGTQTTASAAANEGSRKNKVVRVGLIGCGGRGTHLAGSLLKLRDQGEAVEIVAVCDIYQPRLERAATKFSAKFYSDYRELVRDPNVDAVIVATPDRVHVFNTLEAVRAGKDVYSEKPVTHWRQFDKLKELVRETRKAGNIFQVGAQYVSDPIWPRAAEFIEEGGIGKPVHAETGFFRWGDFGEAGMPIEDPKAQPGPGLDWEAFQGDAPKRSFSLSRFFQWRLYMDYAGGLSTDLFVHRLTPLFKALNPGLPETVVALGGKYHYDGGRDVPDTFDVLIKYPQGLTVAVLGTIANDSGNETVIRGTKGTMRFPGESNLGLTIEPQPEVMATRQRFLVHHLRYELDHLQNFLHSVRTRERPVGDLELGYIVQVPMIMSMLSYVEGKVAHFDPDLEEISLG